MNESHLTEEEHIDLYYNPSSSEMDPLRRHLQTCGPCRDRYAELTAALDLAKHVPVPRLHPGKKTEMFQQAWSESKRGTHERPTCPVGWALLRHAFSFSMGLACGIALLAFITAGSAKAIPNSEIPLRAPGQQTDTPRAVGGSAVEKIYSDLENPVIVIFQKEEQSQQEKRILEGTMENGSIQVVWNL